MSKVFTPQELEKMARLGQLGILTGDRVLAPLGEIGIKRSQAIHELQLDDAQKQAVRDQEAAKLAEYGRWNDEDRALKREELQARLQDSAADRALRRELERMGLDAIAGKAGSDELKAGSAAEQRAREADRLVREAERLASGMPSGAVHRGKDVVSDYFSGVRPSFGQLAGSAFYDEDQNKWRADADRFDQDLSNLAAGLAITGFELENKQKWSPRAPGISAADAKARFDNIKRTFAGKSEAIRGGGGKSGGASGDWKVVR